MGKLKWVEIWYIGIEYLKENRVELWWKITFVPHVKVEIQKEDTEQCHKIDYVISVHRETLFLQRNVDRNLRLYC